MFVSAWVCVRGCWCALASTRYGLLYVLLWVCVLVWVGMGVRVNMVISLCGRVVGFAVLLLPMCRTHRWYQTIYLSHPRVKAVHVRI
jgi:hypothetical protein